MNLRRKRPNDSLDMLLDTMCNTFGGIILLAVLVTLLTSRERHGNAATASDTQEMLQRRVAMAQADLRHAIELQTSLQAKADDGRWKTQVSLLSTRQQIQDQFKTIRELAAQNAKEIDAAASVDPAERMKILNTQLAAAQVKKLEAQNSLAASKENSKRLNTRLAGLEKQATDLVNESQRHLRLPKEHETGKRVIYVIVRYGRIYTCRNADLSRNETRIEWTSTLTGEIRSQARAKELIKPRMLPHSEHTLETNQETPSIWLSVSSRTRSRPLSGPNSSRPRAAWPTDRIPSGLPGPVAFSAVGHTPKPQ